MKKIIIIALLLIQNLQAKSEIDIVVIYKSDKEIERTEKVESERTKKIGRPFRWRTFPMA